MAKLMGNRFPFRSSSIFDVEEVESEDNVEIVVLGVVLFVFLVGILMPWIIVLEPLFGLVLEVDCPMFAFLIWLISVELKLEE